MPLLEGMKPFVPDPEREKQGRELDILGPERRLTLLREGDPADPMQARLVASLVRTHPEMITAEHIDRLDGYAMAQLTADEARIQKVAPRVRLAMVKAYATRTAGTPDEIEAAGFAGTVAAGLLRQHPQAAGEVILNAPGELKGKLTLVMLARMSDDELMKLPREALMALSKEVQGGDRRHVARLMRLMNTKR